MSTRTEKNFSKNSLDFTLVIIVIMLLAIGIVMVLSASAPQSISEVGNSYFYFNRQIKFAIGGLVLMFLLSKFDYHYYKPFYKILYVIALGTILLTQIKGIGVDAKGATRWVSLLGIRFQPSEMAKVMLILSAAGFLEDKKEFLGTWKGLVAAGIFLGIPVCFLFFLQNHLSAGIVISAILVIMLFMSGTKMRDYYLVMSGLGVGGIVFVISQIVNSAMNPNSSFRLKRILTFLNPWSDKQDTGWQVIQGLYALGSGGLFGVGLGKSTQKYLYIPEPHNDFIFAIIGEELGFVGCFIIILLYMAFIWRGAVIAMKAPDTYGGLVAVGVTSLIGIQAIFNIAVVTSSMPATGMSLPFISYGGTSLLILLSCVGILLNISRAGSKN